MKKLTLSQADARYLVRKLIIDGCERGLSLVVVNNSHVEVFPFAEETHSTVMLDGRLIIETENGKIKKLEIEA